MKFYGGAFLISWHGAFPLAILDFLGLTWDGPLLVGGFSRVSRRTKRVCLDLKIFFKRDDLKVLVSFSYFLCVAYDYYTFAFFGSITFEITNPISFLPLSSIPFDFKFWWIPILSLSIFFMLNISSLRLLMTLMIFLLIF